MSRFFNISGALVLGLMGASADATDWSALSGTCPAMFEACRHSGEAAEASSSDFVDARFRTLAPKGDSLVDFAALKETYDALTTGQGVSSEAVWTLVHQLEADALGRERLLRYAEQDEASSMTLLSAELRHYDKELHYLKSLQRMNEKQMAQLALLSETDEVVAPVADKVATLQASLTEQAKALNAAVDLISQKLKQDADTERDVVRYLSLTLKGEAR